METPRIIILADDLIWSTRLADLVRAAGDPPIVVRRIADLQPALPGARAVIVDLTSRAYDGIAAVQLAAGHGIRVLCIGQHDDHELRKRVLEAGAERVFAYRLLFERGPETLSRWLSVSQAAAAPGGAEP